MHDVAPSVEEVPAAQFRHAEPEEGEYRPLEQSVQAEAPVMEDLPAGQLEQGVLSFVMLIFPTVICGEVGGEIVKCVGLRCGGGECD